WRRVVRKPHPPRLPESFIQDLLDNEIVRYEPMFSRAVWFGITLLFSYGRNEIFRILWENFLKGNVPIQQRDIFARARWPGVTNMSNLFKRSLEWEEVIASDGNGWYWLHIPENWLPVSSQRPTALPRGTDRIAKLVQR